jgi:hypothetical protein
MIARVLLLRYPQNVAALGPVLWRFLALAVPEAAIARYQRAEDAINRWDGPDGRFIRVTP